MDPVIRTNFILFIEQHGGNIPIISEDIDLTEDQKRNKLIHWLDSDPTFFFEQVHAHLPPELTNLWHPNSVQSSQQHTQELTPSQRRSIIRNRRYHYLVNHLRHSDYFSEESIQLRVPSLYEEYIGQHIPDKERYAPFGNEVSLVDRVYEGMNRRYVQDQWQQNKRSEDEQFEEQDDDDDDDDDDDENAEEKEDDDMTSPLTERSTNHLIGIRQQKKDELIRLLEEQWMDGMDDQFDYSVVDHDETYDDLVQLNQDMQDRYFDDELEEENGPNNDTGVLDY